MSKNLVVIGGGAAGFFCAVNAARMSAGLNVTIIEKTNKLLSKVKVSGGGRCNVTHACFDIADMSKQYPRGQHFVRKAFHQFFTTDIIRWFEERGVRLKTEDDGRMFPVTDSSKTIIDSLLREANEHGVEILMNTEVKSLSRMNGQWSIRLSDSRLLIADYCCVATGGYPKPEMFYWLKELGHTIEKPVPSLFTFNLPNHPITKLMGVSVGNSRIKILPKESIRTNSRLEEEGPLLITHWGLSGPAVLRLSAWGARELKLRNYASKIFINWLPGFNEDSLRKRFIELRAANAAQKIVNKNVFGLPSRLWEFLAELSGIKNEWRWADLPSAEQNKFIKNLCNYECEARGKTTFKEEFVTAGGIKLDEVDANTMMSKKIPTLFFAGEVLDVDGITGGFNFQHAWTSGFIAAKAIVNLSH